MTTQTTQYPKALMANIEAANIRVANHYVIADQILSIAKSDVSLALRHGSQVIAGTLRGNVTVYRAEARGFYKVVPFGLNPMPIFEGSKAETIAFLSTIYRLES